MTKPRPSCSTYSFPNAPPSFASRLKPLIASLRYLAIPRHPLPSLAVPRYPTSRWPAAPCHHDQSSAPVQAGQHSIHSWLTTPAALRPSRAERRCVRVDNAVGVRCCRGEVAARWRLVRCTHRSPSAVHRRRRRRRCRFPELARSGVTAPSARPLACAQPSGSSPAGRSGAAALAAWFREQSVL